MTASTIADAGIAIWQRAIERRQKKLAPEAARALLNLHLAKHDLDRADALAAKRCKGRITEREGHELEAYRMVGTTMELLQSKARLALGIRPRVARSMRASLREQVRRRAGGRCEYRHIPERLSRLR